MNAWLDGQENISQSLRLLIRESIQCDGYTDVVNKPVEQFPRRGRPPLPDVGDQRLEQTATQMDDESGPEEHGDPVEYHGPLLLLLAVALVFARRSLA